MTPTGIVDNFDRQAAARLALIFGPPGATRFALALRRSPGLAQTVQALLSGSLVEEVHLDDDADRDWRRALDDVAESPACRCGAAPHSDDANRCEKGHMIAGNQAALVVGHRSRRFWLQHAEAQREIRDAIITDAGHEPGDAPRALELAADGAAQAALIRDAAFVRMVEQGGPLTTKQKTRAAFNVWCAALDRAERHLRLVGLRREPRPIRKPAVDDRRNWREVLVTDLDAQPT